MRQEPDQPSQNPTTGRPRTGGAATPRWVNCSTGADTSSATTYCADASGKPGWTAETAPRSRTLLSTRRQVAQVTTHLPAQSRFSTQGDALHPYKSNCTRSTPVNSTSRSTARPPSRKYTSPRASPARVRSCCSLASWVARRRARGPEGKWRMRASSVVPRRGCEVEPDAGVSTTSPVAVAAWRRARSRNAASKRWARSARGQRRVVCE